MRPPAEHASEQVQSRPWEAGGAAEHASEQVQSRPWEAGGAAEHASEQVQSRPWEAGGAAEHASERSDAVHGRPAEPERLAPIAWRSWSASAALKPAASTAICISCSWNSGTPRVLAR